MSIELKSKNPWIQILRAISVLVVIAYHFDLPVSNGFIGVDIFFVISGYVITQSLMRSSEDSWFSRLRLFYVKRVARLFPAFLTVFIFTITASILFLSPNVGVQQNAVKSSLGAALGISNFVIPRVTGDYFGASGNTNPFQHTWSLSVEEQFYFLFPIMFLFFFHKKVRNRSFSFGISVLALVAMLSFSFLLPFDIFDKVSNLGTTEYFAPQNRAWEFLVGVIAASLPASSIRVQAKSRARLLNTLCALLVSIAASSIFTFQTNLYQVIIPVILASTFLYVSDMTPADSNNTIKLSRFRDSFVTMGDWSYSLYLWHWPIWIFTKLFFPESKAISILIASFFTFTLSALTYRLIETRYDFARKNRKKYWFKFFLIGQALAISLFFLGYQGLSKGWGKDWALSSHKVISAGCDNGVISSSKCQWGIIGNERIAIIGDSMSWAIADPIIDFGVQNNFSVRAYTKNGCPAGYPTKKDNECKKWQIYVTEELILAPPKIVVIANAESDNLQNRRSFKSLLTLLNDINLPTLVVLPPPGGDQYSDKRSLLFSPGLNDRTSPLIPLSKALSELKSTLINYPNARYLDPSDVLCKSRCEIAANGRELYNYGKHLSVYGSSRLEDAIRLRIIDLLSYSRDSNTNKASM